MKPTFGSAYLDDYLTQFTTIHYSFHVTNRGYGINRDHYFKRAVINIRARKNISGLVKVSVTSPAGLMKFFLNVEPCCYWEIQRYCFVCMYVYRRQRGNL